MKFENQLFFKKIVEKINNVGDNNINRIDLNKC